MNKNKDIASHNEQGYPHGYWELYYSSDGKILLKGHYVNGEKKGYWEWYNIYGELTQIFYT